MHEGSPVAHLQVNPTHLLHVLISTQFSLYDQKYMETTFTVYEEKPQWRTECFGFHQKGFIVTSAFNGTRRPYNWSASTTM